ncbi:DUF2514 family protein [Rubrivivax sp. JA1026]|uniref:DUF2514 family protein n=1 Tax=Rubrivivax sp. JA1026 TaxID=2710888 RepID=UPI0013E96D3A|nr:DUF2514 family protein [Rubrivivax sp. JA1026]
MGVIAALLRAIPLWAWAVAAALAWGGLQRYRAHAAGAELLQQQAQTAQQREQALTGALVETGRRLNVQAKEIDRAKQETERQRLARAAADAAADELRAAVDARVAAAASAAAADPAAAGGCAAAVDAARVLAELHRAADERAGAYARIADERGAAGARCERLYDSLTPPGGPP